MSAPAIVLSAPAGFEDALAAAAAGCEEEGVPSIAIEATGTAAEQFIRPASDGIHNRTMIPGRRANGVVHALILKIRDVFIHALEVFSASFGLHETEEIGTNLRSVRIASRPEEMGEGFNERHDSPDAAQYGIVVVIRTGK